MTDDERASADDLMMSLGQIALMVQLAARKALIEDGATEAKAIQYATGMVAVIVINAVMEYPEWARAVGTLLERAGDPGLRDAYSEMIQELVKAVPVTIVHEPEGGAG